MKMSFVPPLTGPQQLESLPEEGKETIETSKGETANVIMKTQIRSRQRVL